MTLIERLQEASEGSRELSDECLLAVGWRFTAGGPKFWFDPNDNSIGYSARPSPSENLQDALDWMVPEGWEFTLNVSKKGCVVCLCAHWDDDTASVFWSNRADESERGKFYKRRIGSSLTPALALSAASLRAREAMKEKDDVD